MTNSSLAVPVASATGTYNLGWAVMRPLLSFNVILSHFWTERDSPEIWQIPFALTRGHSVQIFFFLAFYFCSRHMESNDRPYMKRRARRLYTPVWGWALIYFVVLSLLSLVGSYPSIGFSDLGWQLLTGHAALLNPSLWSQVVMTLLTVILFELYCRSGRYTLLISGILVAISVLMQATGWNEALFGSLRYELRYPLGRIIEMIPFAVAGYLAARYNIFAAERRSALRSVFFLALAFCFMVLTQQHKEDGFGFTYLLIPGALCMVAAFGFAPMHKLGPKTTTVLKFCSSFTLGVYCMHKLMMPFVAKGVSMVAPGLSSFYVCILLYAVCFLTGWLITKLPWPSASRLVK